MQRGILNPLVAPTARLLFLLTLHVTLFNLTTAPTRGQTDPVERRTAETSELIGQLSSPEFSIRERATRRLLDLGEAALEPLQNANAANKSREVRERCQVVQAAIEKKVFEQLSRSFLLDPDGSQSYGLPAWDAFRALVGSSRTSKLLFLESLHSQRELVNLVETVSDPTLDHDSESYRQKQAQLYARSGEEAAKIIPQMYHLSGMGIGDSVGLLFAISALDGLAPVEASQVVYSSTQLGFFGYSKKQGYEDCIQRLLAAWIPRTHDAIAPEVMRIAYEERLPVVLPIARRHLAKTFDASTREFAFYCVAKFGDTSDLPRLFGFMDDTTLVQQFSDSASGIVEARINPPGLPASFPTVDKTPHRLVRINDLAAAAAMLLMKEDPRSLFPSFDLEEFEARSAVPLAVDELDALQRDQDIQAWAQGARAQLPDLAVPQG